MADQDFNIKVVTTADLSGINQTEAGLKRLSIDEANRIGKIASQRQASLRGALTGVPSELTGGAVVAEVEAVASASVLSGVNLARARNEAVTLVRELASGAPVARTVGALLGALGPKLIGGGLAGLFLKNAIDQVATETNKVSDELGKAGEKVVELGLKWRQAARDATSVEDVQRVAESGISEIDRLGQRIREVATSDLTTVQSVLDTVAAGFKNAFTFGGDPNAKGPFSELQDELMRGLGQQQQLLVEQKRRAIEAARANEQLFESYKAKPAADAVSELTTKLANLKSQQDATNVSTADGQKKYADLGQQIAITSRELQAFTAIQKQQQEAAYGAASPQAKAILENEKRARQTGDESFQKTADQLRKFATPADLAQVQAVTDAYPQASRPGRTAGVGESQEAVDQSERNRIAAEAQNKLTDAVQDHTEVQQDASDSRASEIEQQTQEANRNRELEQRRQPDRAGEIERQTQANKQPSNAELITTLRELITIWR